MIKVNKFNGDRAIKVYVNEHHIRCIIPTGSGTSVMHFIDGDEMLVKEPSETLNNSIINKGRENG